MSCTFTRTWLVEKLIDSNRVIEVFGRYKSGKSNVVFDMTAHTSLGWTWAGRRTIPCLVIWVAGEAVEDIEMRLIAWRLRHQVTGPMPLVIRKMPVHIDQAEKAAWLAGEIRALMTLFPGLPVIVVLDTLARNMSPGADENGQGMIAFANNVLDQLVRPIGCTCLVVHHSGHGDGDRGRGHSSFEAVVDGSIKVTKDMSTGAAVLTVSTKDSRSTAGDDTFYFRIEVQELAGTDNFGNAIEAPVLRYLPDHAPQDEKAPGKHEALALKAFHALYAEQHKTLRDGGLSGHPRVLIKDWRKRFYELSRTSDPDMADDSRYKAFTRAKDSGCGGRVRVNGPYVEPVERAVEE